MFNLYFDSDTFVFRFFVGKLRFRLYYGEFILNRLPHIDCSGKIII